MQRRVWFAGVVCVLAVLVLGYAGWKTFAHTDAHQCYACKRPIHAHSKTVAFIDGRSRLFCCPACALSQYRQTGQPIRITQRGKRFRPITHTLCGQATSTCASGQRNLWMATSGLPIYVMIAARPASSLLPDGATLSSSLRSTVAKYCRSAKRQLHSPSSLFLCRSFCSHLAKYLSHLPVRLCEKLAVLDCSDASQGLSEAGEFTPLRPGGARHCQPPRRN